MTNKVRVVFEVYIPTPGASMEDITEWIEYEIKARGGMSMNNILEPYEIESSGSVTVEAID